MDMETLDVFFSNTTPQFYVILTGTSTVISGIVLFIEWLAFIYYGVSVSERIFAIVCSVLPTINSGDEQKTTQLTDLKPVRNPLVLFRGAEYNRFQWVMDKEPLTFFDMNLSAQEHQVIFACDEQEDNDSTKALMSMAWRATDPLERISYARKAIEANENLPAAWVLLAEEEATTITEVESNLREALSKTMEMGHKGSYSKSNGYSEVMVSYIKVRLAQCVRKLGRVKEAIKIYRELLRDPKVSKICNVTEGLIEASLEQQSYLEVQQIIPQNEKSATYLYSSALCIAKGVSDKFCPENASKRGLNTAELAAVEAIHLAVEYNPHVPKYLLEQKNIILPPEHYASRGDSEAVMYAFHHLQHWKRVPGALNLLSCTWEGTFRLLPFPLEQGHHHEPYPASTTNLDKEILPAHHTISIYPRQEVPFFIVFSGILCFSFMTLTVIAYHFPNVMTQYAKAVTTIFLSILDKLQAILPSQVVDFIQQ
ncbi:protein ST7 homolog [Dysidea avara]|uniref:protein ST7 homolog n=1 Tax=Dysidea avara TaxID=196820 RepID=UPI00332F2268